MSRHFVHDLEEAFHQLLELSGTVEQMIEQSIKALNSRDSQLAATVIASDEKIDRTEVQIEEECLKMLALHQPVATDLRRLTTMMKVNNDLEHIADLACGIAERADRLADYPAFCIPDLIERMAQQTVLQVRTGLNAFVHHDTSLAEQVIASDDDIDRMNGEVIQVLTGQMQTDANWIPPAIECFSAARSLEQIADHAVNVAEDVIYMVEGVIVRHRYGTRLSGHSDGTPPPGS
ncbi:MAG: phosphate transport system regulatory protein PhoU [Planctomycetota bacterium]|nr:MAG: phosphate transport system regulatory protein PhoU [Planctomycetota bacterium]